MRHIIGLLVLPVACRETAPAPQHRETALTVVSRFEEAFRRIDSISLEAPPPVVIGRLADAAIGAGGLLALPDASEGDVKLVPPAGGRWRVFGRKGGGPGEFAFPASARFDSATRSFHVLDLMMASIQVFDDTGGYLRSFAPKRTAPITAFEIRPKGAYLVAQERPGTREVLHELDQDGEVVRRILPIGGRMPLGVPPRADWRAMRASYFRIRGDSALVISSLAESLWTVPLEGGKASVEGIPVPGYSPPTDLPLKTGLRGPQLMAAWAKLFHRASRIELNDDDVFIAFTKGVLFQGDTTTLMVKTRTGAWEAYDDAPLVLTARDSVLIGTYDMNAETIKLVSFIRRSR